MSVDYLPILKRLPATRISQGDDGTEVKADLDLLHILNNKVNTKFLPLLRDSHRYIVVKGGASSGKSYSAAEKIIYKMLTEPGHRYLIVRKVARTLRHSVFSLLSDIIKDWGLTQYFKLNGGELFVKGKPAAGVNDFEAGGSDTVSGFIQMQSNVKWKDKQLPSDQQNVYNEMIFAGLDDVEKLKSIHGITDIWIEEASEITEADFNQLDLRMRGHTRWKKQITLTFNPISILHWLKKRFFDRPPVNSTLHNSVYKDNEHLDEDTKLQLQSITDPYFKKVYVEGDWGVYGNVVFTDYVVEDFDLDETVLENISNGMDFGFVHASAIIRLGFHEGGLYVFDELFGKGWTNNDFMEAAEEYWGEEVKNWYITADSAEPDRIVEWQRAGYVRVRAAKKGKGSVRYGVDFLCSYKMHIHATKCPNMAREVQSFKRREDKDGNAIEDFVELNDDCIAAARYASEDLWQPYRGNVPEYALGDLGL